jgi:hypothetical protein
VKAVLVTGGRDYDEFGTVSSALVDERPDLVIHGCAKGVDSLASRYAQTTVNAEARFPADWTLYGRSAGPRRNMQMVEFARDLTRAGWEVVVLAFPGGRGTENCIETAERAGLTVKRVTS